MYRPIDDYGIVGDTRSIALVSREGSADSLPPCSLEETRRFWVDWLDSSLVRRVKPPPELEGMINRSLLTLKLLIYAPAGEWESAKKRIAEDLFRRGYSRRRESFVQRYDSEELDAVLLLLSPDRVL